MLYVTNSNIDTKGMIYPRALQQTAVGCYLLILCLVGLFAISTGSDRNALGPLILMIVFLVFVVIYHVSLNAAVTPLLEYLPRNLEAEEQDLLAKDGSPQDSNDAAEKPAVGPSSNGADGTDAEKGISNPTDLLPTKPHGIVGKFLRPDRYANYETLRKLVPKDFADISYTPEVEQNAYFHPSVGSKPPLLWIPRDVGGVSRQEVAHTSKVIAISDEDATIDAKSNKITWNEEKGMPPIYQEPIYY